MLIVMIHSVMSKRLARERWADPDSSPPSGGKGLEMSWEYKNEPHPVAHPWWACAARSSHTPVGSHVETEPGVLACMIIISSTTIALVAPSIFV